MSAEHFVWCLRLPVVVEERRNGDHDEVPSQSRPLWNTSMGRRKIERKRTMARGRGMFGLTSQCDCHAGPVLRHELAIEESDLNCRGWL
eukprot:2860621-Rhodomonas_salina.2